MKKVLCLVLALLLTLSMAVTASAVSATSTSVTEREISVIADRISDAGKSTEGKQVYASTAPVSVCVDNSDEYAKDSKVSIYADYYPGKVYGANDVICLSEGEAHQITEHGTYLIRYEYVDVAPPSDHGYGTMGGRMSFIVGSFLLEVGSADITQQFESPAVTTDIKEITSSITAINNMRNDGIFSASTFWTLAEQVQALETAAAESGEGGSERVAAAISSAEATVEGLESSKTGNGLSVSIGQGDNYDDLALAVGAVQYAVEHARTILGISADAPINTPSGQPTTTPTLKGFRDVAESRWSHSAIMEMVGLGMFAGTEAPDANGMGKFEPEGTMSRAQLITVVTRHLYADTLAGMAAGQYWYSNNYTVALNNGIITESEFSADSLNDPITRQEMAMVMVRAALKQGETLPDLVSTSRIADYATIGAYYQNYVRQAFSMGLLAGYDDKGTFGPKDTLTREQGAMVVYRLVNMDSRVKVDTETEETPEYSATEEDGIRFAAVPSPAGPITIYEGQTRTNRPARVGDIFVKADGTKITLELGPSGVLGEGQGVAPDAGLIDSSGKAITDNTKIYFRIADFGERCDCANAKYNNQKYQINKYTGEGHTENEWAKMASSGNYPKPTREGAYNNEVYTADGFCCWKWNVNLNDWILKP